LSISLLNVTTNGVQKNKTCDLGHFGKQWMHFYGNKNNVEIILKISTHRENNTISTKILNGMIKGF